MEYHHFKVVVPLSPMMTSDMMERITGSCMVTPSVDVNFAEERACIAAISVTWVFMRIVSRITTSVTTTKVMCNYRQAIDDMQECPWYQISGAIFIYIDIWMISVFGKITLRSVYLLLYYYCIII